MNEAEGMYTSRIVSNVLKSFKPGNMEDFSNRNILPTVPGYDKIQFYKKNKPSKGRVNINPHAPQKNDAYMYSDMGGDGGY